MQTVPTCLVRTVVDVNPGILGTDRIVSIWWNAVERTTTAMPMQPASTPQEAMIVHVMMAIPETEHTALMWTSVSVAMFAKATPPVSIRMAATAAIVTKVLREIDSPARTLTSAPRQTGRVLQTQLAKTYQDHIRVHVTPGLVEVVSTVQVQLTVGSQDEDIVEKEI